MKLFFLILIYHKKRRETTSEEKRKTSVGSPVLMDPVTTEVINFYELVNFCCCSLVKDDNYILVVLKCTCSTICGLLSF